MVVTLAIYFSIALLGVHPRLSIIKSQWMALEIIKDQRRGIKARWVSTWRQVVAVWLSRGPVVTDILGPVSVFFFFAYAFSFNFQKLGPDQEHGGHSPCRP